MITIDQEFQTLLMPLSAEEQARLEQNIIENGCLDPLKLWGEVLLDGHNRHAICARRGIEFKTESILLPDRKAAHDWIINNQLGRRNVTLEQASYLRGKRYLSEKAQGERRDLTSGKNCQKLQTSERLAEEYKVAEKTIRNDAVFAQAVDAIAESVGVEARQDILSGETKLSKQDVVYVASLPVEKQREVVEQGSQAPKHIQALKNEERRQERLEKIASISQASVSPLETVGQYPLIYADPPWQYEFCSDEADQIENHYPTMALDDICALPVQDVATDDCILFLWVPSPKLLEAGRVIESWGFNYRTCAVWDKGWIGPGYYFRQRHELLLVATRGNIPAPNQHNRPPSVFTERRTEHSRKPETAYQLIEQMYPELPKLELFARSPRQDWRAWGYEAEGE